MKEELNMSKMAELNAAVSELRKCGEILIDVSESLRSLFSTNEEQPPVTPPEPAEKKLTIEDVRPVLAKKSIEGHNVQALILKYGAKKLSEVDPAHYADLLHDAEVL